MVGYHPNQVDFRWFDAPAAGLRGIYQFFEPTRGVHVYLTEQEASNLPDGRDGVELAGYASMTQGFGPLRGLAKLRRFLHPTFAHHVLTTDRTRVGELLRAGYREVASLGYVLTNRDASNPRPVAELTAPVGAARRYATAPYAELDLADYASGGHVFRVFPRPSDVTVPLYRAFDPGSHDELLTTSRAQRDSFLARGYRDEGILGFVFPHAPSSVLPIGGAAALQRLQLATGEHAYTADRPTFERLLDAGAVSDGIAGYIARQPNPGNEPVCRPHPRCGPNEDDPGQRLIRALREVRDDRTRQIAAALTLNGMCALRRVLEGSIETHAEALIADRVARADAFTRETMRRNTIASLEAVLPDVRAELLGPLGNFDPGLCDPSSGDAPDFDSMIQLLHLELGVVPHLRTSFCSDALTYDIGTDPPETAERAVSVGTETVRPDVLDEFLDVPERAASTARPVIEGVDTQDRPEADLGHPALIRDWHDNHQPPPIAPGEPDRPVGDGLSPYGVDTGIGCSLLPEGGDTCDRSSGLLCGSRIGLGPTCHAFPIVQRDGEIVLRGWNFWDVHEAQLRFESIDRPGVGAIEPVVSVAANELDPAGWCSRASPDNLTHNTASFETSVEPGFYRLTMFNHNGHFFTQGDAARADHDPPGRTIHVCWPDEDPRLEPVEATRGTRRDCTPPTEACDEDGPRCRAAWHSAPPRPLSECRHDVREAPACGETPEWIASEPRWGGYGIPVRQGPIVFVRESPPLFTMRASLQQVECLEESGSDWAGSDELTSFIAGAADAIPDTPDPDDLDHWSSTFTGEFDTDTRRRFARDDARLMSELRNVASTALVSHMLYLAEDDDTVLAQILGTLVIGVAAVIVVAIAGASTASIIGAAGSAAVLAILWNVFLGEVLHPNDVLGFTTVRGSPYDHGDRIAATHFSDFLSMPPPITPLPLLEDGPQRGRLSSFLLHPFDLDSDVRHAHLVECTGSGACADTTGATGLCYVNQCITEPGFTGPFSDPTFNRGFRERRDIDNRDASFGEDARYVFDVLWERIPEG